MSNAQRIDDRDSWVVYSKPLLGRDWTNHGGPQEYLSTTSLTRKQGANARITFSGSSIAVYGSVSSSHVDSGTTSLYSIDGGTGTTYTTTPAREAQYGVKFFESGSLSPGQHTLEVINGSDGGWFWLDYFDIALANNSTTSAIPTSTTSANLTSSTALTTSSTPTSSTSSLLIAPTNIEASQTDVPTPTGSSDSSTASGTSNTKGSPAGMIVGFIFGGIFLIAVVVALIWFVRRTRADRFADEAAVIPTESPITPTSKPPQGFASTHQSNGSRNVAQYDIPISPNTAPNMTQMHYQHQHQRSQQYHTQYGSGTSNPNIYPFSPSAGGAQQAYHPVNGQRGPSSYPGMQFSSQQQQYPQQQAYGHHPAISPPHVGTASNVNYPGGAGAYAAGGVSETSVTPEKADYTFSGPGAHRSSIDTPPAYPGSPPGLSTLGTQ